MGGSPTTLGFPGMHMKPLFPSRRITILPCASVPTILAALATSGGPADIARAISTCVGLSPSVAAPLINDVVWAEPRKGIPAMNVIAAINVRSVRLCFVSFIRNPFRPSDSALIATHPLLIAASVSAFVERERVHRQEYQRETRPHPRVCRSDNAPATRRETGRLGQHMPTQALQPRAGGCTRSRHS